MRWQGIRVSFAASIAAGDNQSDACGFDEFFRQGFVSLVAFLMKVGVNRKRHGEAAAEP